MIEQLARIVPLPRELAALHAANTALWRLEDRVRDTDDLLAKGRLKIRIDRANLHRHACVAALDAELRRRWPRGAAPSRGYLSSESIGQMLDRGSILALKRATLDHAALDRKWAHLVACLERAMAAVRAGRFVHHDAGEIKSYGALSRAAAPRSPGPPSRTTPARTRSAAPRSRPRSARAR